MTQADLKACSPDITVGEAADKASALGAALEQLIVQQGGADISCNERDLMLLMYWAVCFDTHKSILALLQHHFYGGAFALLRPSTEAMVRAHIVVKGSDEDLRKIADDSYRTNFGKVGKQIDEAFEFKGLIERFLNEATVAGLHSFTHCGTAQLARRVKGADLTVNYSDILILQLINCTTTAMYLVTYLVATRFEFGDAAMKAGGLFKTWADHR